MRDGVREHWLGRAAAQSTAYVAFVVVVFEVLKRERVVTEAQVLTRPTLLVTLVAWLAILAYRAYRERTG
jgi:hypothetical protein